MKLKMKKILSCFYLFTVLTAILFLGGCGKQAELIALPAVNEIDSIDITTLDGSKVSYSDKEWIEQFLTIVAQAEATVKESIQVVPTHVETYGKVHISNNGGITTFFYYIEDERYFIEQPYQGIYETDVDIDAFVNGVE